MAIFYEIKTFKMKQKEYKVDKEAGTYISLESTYKNINPQDTNLCVMPWFKTVLRYVPRSVIQYEQWIACFTVTPLKADSI